MSAFDDALVTVLIADYIGVDGSGKFTIAGGGFQWTAVQQTGMTVPQYVLAIAELPAKYIGQQIPFGIELFSLTEDGAVKMPGPTGKIEAVRAEQAMVVPQPNFAVPGFVPPTMTTRLQIIMGFQNGLPLRPGDYEWRVRVEGKRRKGWVARFNVLEPEPPPVVGGPANSPHIPGTEDIDAEPDDDAVE